LESSPQYFVVVHGTAAELDDRQLVAKPADVAEGLNEDVGFAYGIVHRRSTSVGQEQKSIVDCRLALSMEQEDREAAVGVGPAAHERNTSPVAIRAKSGNTLLITPDRISILLARESCEDRSCDYVVIRNCVGVLLQGRLCDESMVNVARLGRGPRSGGRDPSRRQGENPQGHDHLRQV